MNSDLGSTAGEVTRLDRSPHVHLPVRLRLTLWYTALLAGALVLFSGTVYVLMSRSLVSNLDVSLQQRVNQIIPSLDVANGHVTMPQPAEQPDTPFIPVVLLTRSGQPATRSAQGSPKDTIIRRGQPPRVAGEFLSAVNPSGRLRRSRTYWPAARP
jgi:hypothetical protein